VAYRYDGVSDLRKAAPHRIQDARKLLEPVAGKSSDRDMRHLNAACYLAGYAVECILKVYLIAFTVTRKGNTPLTWTETRKTRGWERKLAGARQHNLELLRSVTDLEGAMDSDTKIKAAWGVVIKNWDVALRYCGRPQYDGQRADEVVEACDTVYQWVKKRANIPS
jgi:hypothetical protein